MRQLTVDLLPYSGIGLKAIVLYRSLLRFRLSVKGVTALILVRDLGLPRNIPSRVFCFRASAGHGKGDTALVYMAAGVIGKPSSSVIAFADIDLGVKAVISLCVCVPTVLKCGMEFRRVGDASRRFLPQYCVRCSLTPSSRASVIGSFFLSTKQ